MGEVTTLRPRAKPRQVRKPKPGVQLIESEEHEGFQTLDVINGLHGICEALDERAEDFSMDTIQELAISAKILSSILRRRVM